MAKRLRTSTLTEISTLINKQGTDVSPCTIRCRLNEQGLLKLQPLCKPLLSDINRDNWLKWANSNKKRGWSNIIFTDEATFSQFGKPKKVWWQWGEIIKAPTVKHSAHVHVYGCFSEKGFGKIYCFTQTLNVELLCTIYNSTLLPSAITFFGQDNNNWFLQEDNDPKHTSKKAKDWKVKIR